MATTTTSVRDDKSDKSDGSSFEELVANESEGEPDAKAPAEEWQDVLGSGAILKKVVKEGKAGERPQRGDVCRVNIEGRLADGDIVEDRPDFELYLGDGDVIQGVDLVVALMDLGEVCEVKIAPRFGYGDRGLPPQIPPSADLVYTLELTEFAEEPEIETLGLEDRKIIGNKKRERGNWWYEMREPAMAIKCYRKAIDYLDESKGGITEPTLDGNFPVVSEELHSLLEDRIKTYNNMAAAQMKQGTYDAALSSIDIVLSCQPNNVKALFRKGKILSYKNEIPKALAIVKRALNLAPDDKAIRAELARLEDRDKRDTQKERDLARKMLGGSSDGSGSSKSSDKGRPKKKGGKKFLIWGSVVFSIAIGIISVVVYRYKYY